MDNPLSKVPIIVGVADVVNRSKKIQDAIEPAQLMLQAIQSAIQDTGLASSVSSALQSEIDSISVVRTWTWPYPDLPGLLSERLAIDPVHRVYPEQHGGNQPAALLDEAARRISKGQTKVAVVTGGEALASLSACAAAKQMPPPNWTAPAEEVRSVFSPTTRELQKDVGSRHSIGNPIQLYPLYENAFRAHRNQSIGGNHAESTAMYAEFAKIAEGNEHAWNYGTPAETAESIGTVSKKNRMICLPYPLLMNAFNTVNLAAACIVTSTEYAKELGIPDSKWTYVLGGAGTSDSSEFWLRPNFWWSPSISRSLDAGMEASAVEKDDIDLFDFYSCFPIVPKLACHHLKMPLTKTTKPITLLGGLTSFGGAGNNYSMHAITEMSRQLRKGNGKTGLVLANGGWISYQHVVCLSSSPRVDGLPYPDCNPLAEHVTDIQVPMLEEAAEGEAMIETYTVDFDRSGAPVRGHIIGRMKKNGHRFIANHGDERTLKELCSQHVEPVGRSGRVSTDGQGKNRFTIAGEAPKL